MAGRCLTSRFRLCFDLRKLTRSICCVGQVSRNWHHSMRTNGLRQAESLNLMPTPRLMDGRGLSPPRLRGSSQADGSHLHPNPLTKTGPFMRMRMGSSPKRRQMALHLLLWRLRRTLLWMGSMPTRSTGGASLCETNIGCFVFSPLFTSDGVSMLSRFSFLLTYLDEICDEFMKSIISLLCTFHTIPTPTPPSFFRLVQFESVLLIAC